MTESRGARVAIDEGLMVSIVRYALGRATYVVAWTVREVLRVWPELSESTQTVIRRDVREAVGWAEETGTTVGMSCDDDQWRHLLRATAPGDQVVRSIPMRPTRSIGK